MRGTITKKFLFGKAEALPEPDEEHYRRTVRDLRTMAGIRPHDAPYPVFIGDGPKAGAWRGWGMDVERYYFEGLMLSTPVFWGTKPPPAIHDRPHPWWREMPPTPAMDRHAGIAFMPVQAQMRERWYELLSRPTSRGRDT